jgi:phosphatidylserine/phosphatidylglycerophosphate/cardiolipin synthase-like enzyme
MLRVITASAAHGNDETLMIIRSSQLAAHFNREMDQLWQGAELGLTPRLQRKLQQSRQRCGIGEQRS